MAHPPIRIRWRTFYPTRGVLRVETFPLLDICIEASLHGVCTCKKSPERVCELPWCPLGGIDGCHPLFQNRWYYGTDQKSKGLPTGFWDAPPTARPSAASGGGFDLSRFAPNLTRRRLSNFGAIAERRIRVG